MIVLDTTVLVYAKGAEHPLRDPCRALISAVAEGRLSATTTIEVIQELAHVRARRHGPSEAAGLARDYAETLSPLLLLERRDLDGGLEIFETVERLGAFDCVLTAAALERGAEHLVSADRAFADVPGLSHVFPDEEGVARLLGRGPGEGKRPYSP